MDPAQGAVTTMEHHLLHVKPNDKAPITTRIASREGRTIMFVRTQRAPTGWPSSCSRPV